ncbi:MAG: RDD family protein [Xanthomonadales bacterium]|nr:RDD family protein [Xanthomonadales bacterium]
MEDQNPYRTPDAVVAEIADGELADRGTRLGAAIIDTIILLALLLPTMFLGGYWETALANAGQVGFGTTLMWALVGFGVFAAVQFMPLNASGQTWGKKFLKIRIVDMSGNKPPVGRLLGLRYFPVQMAGNVPFVGPLLGIVNVLLIFRADRRCGHDLIAGTKVVRG